MLNKKFNLVLFIFTVLLVVFSNNINTKASMFEEILEVDFQGLNGRGFMVVADGAKIEKITNMNNYDLSDYHFIKSNRYVWYRRNTSFSDFTDSKIKVKVNDFDGDGKYKIRVLDGNSKESAFDFSSHKLGKGYKFSFSLSKRNSDDNFVKVYLENDVEYYMHAFASRNQTIYDESGNEIYKFIAETEPSFKLKYIPEKSGIYYIKSSISSRSIPYEMSYVPFDIYALDKVNKNINFELENYESDRDLKHLAFNINPNKYYVLEAVGNVPYFTILNSLNGSTTYSSVDGKLVEERFNHFIDYNDNLVTLRVDTSDSRNYNNTYNVKLRLHEIDPKTGKFASDFLINKRDKKLNFESLVMDPVDTSTGAFVEYKKLLKYSGSNPLEFNLIYNSLTLNEGKLSKGWSTNFETSLDIKNENIIINWNANNKSTFERNEDGEYVDIYSKEKGTKLEKSSDGSFIFTDKDNSKYIFNSIGQLQEYVNKKNIKQNFLYDDKGNLIKVIQPLSGNYFEFSYNSNNKLEFITDRKNRKIQFKYNKDNNLSNIIDAEGRNLEYVINNAGYVLSIKNNENITIVSNVYDAIGRVIEQRDGRNSLTKFEYDEYSDPNKIITRVINRLGKTETYVHDLNYRLLEKINKNGDSKKFGYDENGNQVYEIDFNGNRIDYVYDDSGNLLEEINDEGIKKSFSYDKYGNITKVINEEGKYTINEYDENGNLISTKDSNNNTIKYSYTDFGSPKYIIDANGNKVLYEYDERGNLISIADKEGNKTYFEIDVLGRIIKTTFPEGNTITNFYDNNDNIIKTIDGNEKEIVKTYNSWNKPLTIIDQLGKITKYTYDGNGNMISQTRGSRFHKYFYDVEDRLINIADSFYDSDYKKQFLITKTYDNEGNLIKETDKLGNYTEYIYDKNGNILKYILNNKYTTTYEYDKNDRISKQIDPDVNVKVLNYDNVGNLIEVIDGENFSKIMSYDDVGNLLKEIDENGNILTFEYDNNNNLVKKIDANDNVTKYEYNKNNLLVKETNPLNESITYSYDNNGNLINVFNALGDVLYTNKYDNLNRLISTTDGLGHSMKFEYDDIGNLLGLYDSKNIKIKEYLYDDLNNVLSEKDALGFIKKFDYDLEGNLLKITDELNRLEVLKRDKLGRLISITDKNKKISSTNYNDMLKVDYLIDPNSNKTNFKYNNLGQIVSEKNASGNELKYYYVNSLLSKTTNARNQSIVYNYDKVGNVISQEEEGNITELEYDKNYNLTSVNESEKELLLRKYDSLNRVIESIDEYGNKILYSYDKLGNLDKITYPDGKEVSYTYDIVGNLKTVIDWNGNITSYEYDENNRLIKTTKPDASEEIRSYNINGQLVILQNKKKNGETISFDTFEYDSVGNVIKENDETYTYDVLDRIISTNYNQFSYDSAGNILSMSKNISGNIITDRFYYGLDNRLSTAYNKKLSYDLDGNLITIPVNKQLENANYDHRNRLITLGNNSYGYDFFNNRTKIVENGIETRFVVDSISNDLSRVLMETDDKGNPINYYVHGVGLIYSEDDKGNNRVYHYDRRGSTIALTDLEGNITDNYKYDIYGELIERVGDTDNRFTYNGKYGIQMDKNGLYQMRSRYYSSEIKRFINRDIIVGDINNPQSLNRYAYLNGNPINYIDPFGLSPLSDNVSKWTHIGLDTVGLVPVIGEIADALNAGVYLAEGNYIDASLSLTAMVPVVGNAVTASKWGAKTVKLADNSDNFVKSKLLEKPRKTNANIACNCFILGTVVLTKGGEKPIEDVRVGDEVLSKDETTGKKEYKKVEWLYERVVDTTYTIYVGKEKIKTTNEHPFWVVEENGWVEAKDLKKGDHLVDVNGNFIEIERIVKKTEISKVYNFKVKDFHNYYVSNLGILTHNACNIMFHKELSPKKKGNKWYPNGQSHHLNQNAAYRSVIPPKEGIAIELRGGMREKGSEHYLAHYNLEPFWDMYRIGGSRNGRMPTNGEYGIALYKSLRKSGLSELDARSAYNAARDQRLKYSLLDNISVPEIPGKIYYK